MATWASAASASLTPSGRRRRCAQAAAAAEEAERGGGAGPAEHARRSGAEADGRDGGRRGDGWRRAALGGRERASVRAAAAPAQVGGCGLQRPAPLRGSAAKIIRARVSINQGEHREVVIKRPQAVLQLYLFLV